MFAVCVGVAAASVLVNGTGFRCDWSADDADWQAGSLVCGWSSTTRVQSICNHGTSARRWPPFPTRTTPDGGAGVFIRSCTWAC